MLDVARNHFAQHGYAQTSLDKIVQDAELTRGALYHHFGNKKGLFQIVLEKVQQEVAERIEMEASKSEDGWEQLLFGCRAFVITAVEPQNSRILLIDGPAVLGWDRWRQLDQQYSMKLLHEQLQFMKEQGYFQSISLEALTHFLSGALNESALWIAQSSNQQQTLSEVMDILSSLLTRWKDVN